MARTVYTAALVQKVLNAMGSYTGVGDIHDIADATGATNEEVWNIISWETQETLNARE